MASSPESYPAGPQFTPHPRRRAHACTHAGLAQAEALQSISTDLWHKPYFQAVMLKSVWALTIPVWAVLTSIQKAMQDEITFRRPLQPTMRVAGYALLMMVLVQVRTPHAFALPHPSVEVSLSACAHSPHLPP